MDTESCAGHVRELALSLPESYEDEPWGHPVFKVADNRMFASMAVGSDCVRLTVKLTAEEREIAHLLPFVSIAKYVGRYGWVTAEITDEDSLAAALEWLRESYWLRSCCDQRCPACQSRAFGSTGDESESEWRCRRTETRSTVPAARGRGRRR